MLEVQEQECIFIIGNVAQYRLGHMSIFHKLYNIYGNRTKGSEQECKTWLSYIF